MENPAYKIKVEICCPVSLQRQREKLHEIRLVINKRFELIRKWKESSKN